MFFQACIQSSYIILHDNLLRRLTSAKTTFILKNSKYDRYLNIKFCFVVHAISADCVSSPRICVLHGSFGTEPVSPLGVAVCDWLIARKLYVLLV